MAGELLQASGTRISRTNHVGAARFSTLRNLRFGVQSFSSLLGWPLKASEKFVNKILLSPI